MGRQASWVGIALLAIALLATGAHAARPIEISEKDDRPMNVLEEQALSDQNRQLLSTHYPPPPPEETSEEELEMGPPPPPLEESDELSTRVSFNFENQTDADEFVSDFDGPHTLPKMEDMSNAYDTEGKTDAQIFGLEFLQSALAGASSNATFGRVSLEQEGTEVYMDVEIYYPGGTPEDTGLESEQIVSSIFNNTAAPEPGSRKLLAVNRNLYDSSGPGAYGSTTDFGTFESAVSDSGFQSSSDTGDDGAAQGLRAGLLSGVAAVFLSFFFLSGISL